MNATFRQLRLYLALADHGSVTAAARATHVTQPTASMQLKELASAVGLPLFEVIGRRVYLTSVGEELARSARAMVDEWAGFTQRVDATKGLTRGQLRVAVVSTAKYFIPMLLVRFGRLFQGIDIHLKIDNRENILGLLARNEADLVVMGRAPSDLDCEAIPFATNPLAIVAAPDHALVRRKQLPFSALGEHRFVVREPGSGTRAAM